MKNEIQNMDRFRQPIIFTGLNFGNIFPTDIDGMIEYKNKSYLFFEIKYREKEVPFGQKLALERLVNDTSEKKHSIALIIQHDERDTNKGVVVKNCFVREVYYSKEKKWRKTIPDKINAYEFMKIFFKFVG